MTAVVRVAKIQAVIFVALVVLLAAFTNIQDYDANFAYVQHVLSMDTTFRHPQVMWRAQAEVDRAKTPGIAGLMGVLALWAFAFLVVGSEWFQMWQSPTWNGRDAAMGYATISLLVLIWFAAPEDRNSPH